MSKKMQTKNKPNCLISIFLKNDIKLIKLVKSKLK